MSYIALPTPFLCSPHFTNFCLISQKLVSFGQWLYKQTRNKKLEAKKKIQNIQQTEVETFNQLKEDHDAGFEVE